MSSTRHWLAGTVSAPAAETLGAVHRPWPIEMVPRPFSQADNTTSWVPCRLRPAASSLVVARHATSHPASPRATNQHEAPNAQFPQRRLRRKGLGGMLDSTSLAHQTSSENKADHFAISGLLERSSLRTGWDAICSQPRSQRRALQTSSSLQVHMRWHEPPASTSRSAPGNGGRLATAWIAGLG